MGREGKRKTQGLNSVALETKIYPSFNCRTWSLIHIYISPIVKWDQIKRSEVNAAKINWLEVNLITKSFLWMLTKVRWLCPRWCSETHSNFPKNYLEFIAFNPVIWWLSLAGSHVSVQKICCHKNAHHELKCINEAMIWCWPIMLTAV